MNKKYMVATGVLSVAVVVAVIFHHRLFPDSQGQKSMADGTVMPPAVMPAHSAALAAPSESAPAESQNETRPAWMNGPGAAEAVRPAAASSPATASDRESNERAARMRAAMSRLEKLQGQKDPDPKAVDDALAEVERAHGSSVLQGVRLDVLRENLRVAARMQKAAGELQSLQQRSAAGELKPAQQAELNQKLAEMETLQRELRMDFFVSNPASARQ
jgi:hypothetical protein